MVKLSKLTPFLISISIQFHSSEFIVFEPPEEATVEKEKLKIQLMGCKLLVATKLFHAEIPRPLKLKSRFMHSVCLQYLADTEAYVSVGFQLVLVVQCQ